MNYNKFQTSAISQNTLVLEINLMIPKLGDLMPWPWKLSTFSRSSAGFIFQQKQEKLRNLILIWESFAQGRFQCFQSARCYHFCIWNHPFHTVRNERLFNEAECLIFHGSSIVLSVLQKSFQKSLFWSFFKGFGI